MAWTPKIYENRPALRERVFGLTAISAVLIGGALAMNSIITGGWQWGATSASPHQLRYDDVDQQWTEPAPSVPVAQPVALASASSADAALASEPTMAAAGALETSTPAVSLLSPAAGTQSQQIETAPSAPIDDAASNARFAQIEQDIRQADAQVRDASPETPSEGAGKVDDDADMTTDPY